MLMAQRRVIATVEIQLAINRMTKTGETKKILEANQRPQGQLVSAPHHAV
jgi:hypothetical protein